jgi:hypothetical protein
VTDSDKVCNAIYDHVPGFAVAERDGRDVLNFAGTWVDVDDLYAGVLAAVGRPA